MDLENIKKEFDKIVYCEDCIFDKTCEALMDNYEDPICSVLEKNMVEE